MSDRTVTVRGKQLKLTNGDKVLYPEAGVTKGDVIAYYERVSDVLLPHLKGRALTMKRYPNGVDEQFFFQKDAPKHRPDWVRTEPIWTRSNGRDVNFLTINSLPALIWIANLASLELHTTMSRAKTSKRPDDDGVRPRPRPAGDRRRMLPGRADAPHRWPPTSGWSCIRRPPDRRGCRSTCR